MKEPRVAVGGKAAEDADAIKLFKNYKSFFFTLRRMKKKYIVFGFFAASSFFGFGQNPENLYPKKKISKSYIQLVYSNYTQDGNHSAVTGGIGTEKLQVFGPEIIIKRQVDSLNSFNIDIGLDVVTSASTDNIDFNMSSASRKDGHGYLTIGIERKLKKNRNFSYGIAGYTSLESDYLSFGTIFSINKTSKDQSKELSAELELYSDDLRWGRLSGVKPLHLIYPAELRFQNWFETYLRTTLNLNLGYVQTINEKLLLGIFPGITSQTGLLATPFQRVYFKTGELKVERLPEKRIAIPLGIQFNNFLGNKFILRNYYRFYHDDFKILAHTLNSEFAIKLTPGITLTPGIRLYTQQGSPYFKPYKAHDIQQEFYTSDYDLSTFRSTETSLEGRFAIRGEGSDPAWFNLRYSHYKRSDGLKANTITLLIDFTSQKNRKAYQ